MTIIVISVGHISNNVASDKYEQLNNNGDSTEKYSDDDDVRQ